MMLAYVGLEIGLVLQNDEFLCGLAYMCGLAERCGLAEWVVLETSCGFPDGCGLAGYFVFAEIFGLADWCLLVWSCRRLCVCRLVRACVNLQNGVELCGLAVWC